MEERRQTSGRDLYETVTAYIDCNKRSNDVAHRWLCSILEPRLGTISAVMNGRPRADDQPAIEEFRVSEIQKQIADKKTELAALEAGLNDARRRGVKAA